MKSWMLLFAGLHGIGSTTWAANEIGNKQFFN